MGRYEGDDAFLNTLEKLRNDNWYKTYLLSSCEE